jgi:hypothetical protein
VATRLPPPGPERDPERVEVYTWTWGSDEGRRPGIPWIGVFLLVFGGLLLVEQVLPQYRELGNLVLLAAGVASLILWAINRGSVALYAGAFLTALALPGTIEALGAPLGPGWGTIFFGLAFLFVGAVRFSQRGGWGWQVWFGGFLVLIGGAQAFRPETASFIWPVLLLGIGLLLVLRGSMGRPR